MRKPIQLTSVIYGGTTYLISLCDDGTIWMKRFSNLKTDWIQVENIPQPKEQSDEKE
jgi:hypothetical protein